MLARDSQLTQPGPGRKYRKTGTAEGVNVHTMPTLPERHEHVVQFYEDSDYLCGIVAEFLVAGLAHGETALVIATEAHGTAIVAHMHSRGIDIERLGLQGRFLLFDARITLGELMRDGVVDDAHFERVIGGTIEHACRGGARVCAYGEMVNLLCEDGKPDGAIALEAMWNALADRHPFRLLCAYAMDNFSEASDLDNFREVCRHHDCALPTERYSPREDAPDLQSISELQQRARSLESELIYRKTLEARLLTTLKERDDLLERASDARADAESANRAKGDFLAVMSHELRTPLNAIAGYTELLELGVAGPMRDSQREMLSRIQTSQRHLLGLIDEILMYTRAENTVRHVVEDVNLSAVLQAAELSMLPQMNALSLTFIHTGCDDTLQVRGERVRVQQIILNLLTNATKYTPRGGTIRMACEVEENSVRVIVRDTGVGIAEEHFESIFEPFFQVDARLTRAVEGLGLGLAIARRFARAMDGDLTVRSSAGEGSAFTLTLPRA